MATRQRPRLEADPRTVLGRKTKRLRAEKKIPGNVFGKGVVSTAITVDLPVFEKLFRLARTTSLIDLSIRGEQKVRPVLIFHVQRHPVTDRILHIDFHQVDLTENVTATIPLRVIGEAPAVQDKGAILVVVHPEIQVEALPMDLPDHLEVDVTGLEEFGQSVHAKDIKVDRKKVHLMVDDAETIVTVQEPKKEEEVAPAPVAEAAPAEGEVPAAGGEAKPEEKKEEGEKKEEKKEKG